MAKTQKKASGKAAASSAATEPAKSSKPALWVVAACVAAAIIGGTAITGGSGSVPGGLIGALIVATINSGLVFFSVNPLWQNVVTGGVILLAVGTATLVSHRRSDRLLRLND